MEKGSGARLDCVEAMNFEASSEMELAAMRGGPTMEREIFMQLHSCYF